MHWKFLQRLVSHEKNSIIITEANLLLYLCVVCLKTIDTKSNLNKSWRKSRIRQPGKHADLLSNQ